MTAPEGAQAGNVAPTPGITEVTVVASRLSDDCAVPSQEEVAQGALDPVRSNEGDLALQNRIADELRMPRPKSVDELRALIDARAVVPIVDTPAYRLGDTFAEKDPVNRVLYAHAHPAVKELLDDLLVEGHRCFAKEFAAAERKRLEGGTGWEEPIDRFIINSLTRTEAYQRALARTNKMAARGETKEKRGTHPTTLVFDVSGGPLPPVVHTWLGARLSLLELQGRVVAFKERNGCFHVMVVPGT